MAGTIFCRKLRIKIKHGLLILLLVLALLMLLHHLMDTMWVLVGLRHVSSY
jgi:hypothetical protein